MSTNKDLIDVAREFARQAPAKYWMVTRLANALEQAMSAAEDHVFCADAKTAAVDQAVRSERNAVIDFLTAQADRLYANRNRRDPDPGVFNRVAILRTTVQRIRYNEHRQKETT